MSFILLAALLPLAVSLMVRYWFGLRVLAIHGGRNCSCDLGRWMPPPGDEALVHRAEGSAGDFGAQLRNKALAEWREQDPKAAAARVNALRFGMAVPPLSAMIAVFAVLVGKIPVMGAIAAVLLMTALAAAFGLLTLPPELRAIAAGAGKTRRDRSFPKRDDEDAVVACAIAHAWSESLPPILRFFQK